MILQCLCIDLASDLTLCCLARGKYAAKLDVQVRSQEHSSSHTTARLFPASSIHGHDPIRQGSATCRAPTRSPNRTLTLRPVNINTPCPEHQAMKCRVSNITIPLPPTSIPSLTQARRTTSSEKYPLVPPPLLSLLDLQQSPPPTCR
jgi:hypothetical protein